jgi:acyl-CoA synthetase (AMP-forming)/AMP-acid ligase II
MSAGMGLFDLPGHAAFAGAGTTILAALAAGAARHGARPALEGLGRPALSHAGLHAEVASFAEALRAAGIGRGDVVAVALPNGPEMLAALLGIASVAVALPLASEDPAPEVAALLARLPVRAALVEAGRRSGLREAASAAGLPLIEHAPDAAGPPRLPALPPAAGPAEPTGPADAAIIARTAGTTREPKLVAWSQASLLASAEAAAAWMELTEDDRSLCVMPFAHLHALVRSCLPVLLRGGAVCCAPGFDQVRATGWIEAARPTVITAVPAIPRLLLARAGETGWRPPPGTLRLLASGSDAIDAATAEAIAGGLGVPVREFYGMSEVAPMLAGSAPGQLARADGSIGLPLPPWEVAALDDTGAPLPAGQECEIAARGGMVNPVLGAASRGRSRAAPGSAGSMPACSPPGRRRWPPAPPTRWPAWPPRAPTGRDRRSRWPARRSWPRSAATLRRKSRCTARRSR